MSSQHTVRRLKHLHRQYQRVREWHRRDERGGSARPGWGGRSGTSIPSTPASRCWRDRKLPSQSGGLTATDSGRYGVARPPSARFATVMTLAFAKVVTASTGGTALPGGGTRCRVQHQLSAASASATIPPGSGRRAGSAADRVVLLWLRLHDGSRRS